jgi:hypothetical protein
MFTLSPMPFSFLVSFSNSGLLLQFSFPSERLFKKKLEPKKIELIASCCHYSRFSLAVFPRPIPFLERNRERGERDRGERE